MQANVEGICRGDRCIYAILRTDADVLDVVARTSADKLEIPCATLPLDCIGQTIDGRPAEGLWAIAVPRLAVDMTLTVRAGDDEIGQEPLTIDIHQLASKVSSRLLTHLHPQLAAAARDIEEDNWSGRVHITLIDLWPSAPDRTVWRIRAEFPSDDVDATPALAILSNTGAQIACNPLVMEDQLVPSAHDHGLRDRIVTFSVELAASLGDVCFLARLADKTGFLFVPEHVVRERSDRGRFLAAGPALDPAYERWFDLHRATAADLERQRVAARQLEQRGPLLSLVMPVFRTKPEYLRAAIESVVRQSWSKWELVVANASPDDEAVRAALDEFSRDERIVVRQVPNRSIPDNTNAGIAATTGAYVGFLDHDDVLEPDALWRYAEAISAHPKADLLYCDEDRLRDGHPASPAFKADPQLTLLHSYNYITHLLVVSRRALDLTERSDASTNGAQDYDLTLKAFEVARDIVHIPRVLYHWREHEGSTADGSDQKPFAHLAGKRVLEAHLARRGISASIEDGQLPYTYRVAYDLPQPAPRVSIIIPTKDHVQLLDTCLSSILSKTDYPSYEVVLVENNSTDPETFAYYRKLTEREPRVRVAVWKPDAIARDTPDDGFNYSAICNAGAAAATGDVLVFLNNDTDVIGAGWLRELVGQLQRPEVGIVGAKLLFQDGLVQHCGVMANPAGDNCHVNQNLATDNLGYGYSAAFPMEWSMVTGACQAIRRETFEQLGGYDEQLAVGFNDSDLCLNAHEVGLTCVCTPYALLHHREFSSRGRELGDPAKRARLLREKAYVMGKHPSFYGSRDPLQNPNLNPWSAHWELGW